MHRELDDVSMFLSCCLNYSRRCTRLYAVRAVHSKLRVEIIEHLAATFSTLRSMDVRSMDDELLIHENLFIEAFMC